METMKNKTFMLRERSKSWRETITNKASGRYSREKDVAHEEKKLQISLPRNDFKHTAHIGLNGDSFGQTGFLTQEEIEKRKLPPPENKILQKALTMNKSNSNNSIKKIKSPILEHSITIIRPDRPLIMTRRRNDSESDDDEELPPSVETSDMLSSVLAVMGTTEDGAPQNSNAKIAPFQPVHPESSSDEDITDNEQDITNNDDEEIINDAFAVGPNHTEEVLSEPETIKKDQNSTSTIGSQLSTSFSMRSSASDTHDLRQQKLDAIVNRFHSSSVRSNTLPKSDYTDSEDDENDDGEAFSLDDDEEPIVDPSEVQLRSSVSRKSQNRRSVIDQIQSNDLHILGHKNSLATSEREIML